MRHHCVIASSVDAGLPTGCGGQLAAPDPWREDPGTDAFLDWVSRQCAEKKIGGHRLTELIDGFRNDAQTDH